MVMPENRPVWFVSRGDRETGQTIVGEGYWEHATLECRRGHDHGYASLIQQMRPGDWIAMKGSPRQGDPEDSIRIYARGTVLGPEGDDNQIVRVRWGAIGNPLTTCNSTGTTTGEDERCEAEECLWEVRPDTEANIAFIRQAFGPEFNGANNAPAAPGDRAGDSLQDLAKELYLPNDSLLKEINQLLEEKRQVIFQGPPGTGKTYIAKKLAARLAGSDDRFTLVQFHPSYAYEDFVQGFRPTLKDGQAVFELRDGPLLKAAERARQEPTVNHYLIIDEINRGNLAKIFGELYFLLEYRDEEMTLQYSDADERFSLPPNLFIIGTMNTADRSIALVDLALRRRFYFVEFHPDKEPVKSVLRTWLTERAPNMIRVAGFVDRANERLKERLKGDRHAAIGPSYFMREGLDAANAERIWKYSIEPYVEERLVGDEGSLDEFKWDQISK